MDIQTDINSQGSVLLLGTVENQAQRQKAEELVGAVAGVTSVRNQLVVPTRD